VDVSTSREKVSDPKLRFIYNNWNHNHHIYAWLRANER